MLPSLTQDVSHGIRQLRLSPGFTLVAVLSLALGVGANTSMFQLMDAIRLKMLPVRDPRELVTVDFAKGSARAGYFSTRSARLTYAQWDQVRARQQAFRGVLAWSAARFNLAAGGEARYAEGLFVSGGFFPLLGVSPLLGRTFTAQDDSETCPGAGAVLSHAFWQREYGGNPGVLTRAVTLDGQTFPVIGVTPQSFFGVEVGNRFDVALPLCADTLLADDRKGRIPVRDAFWLSVMGRLKPGWTTQQATAQLQAASPAIMQATLPETYKTALAKKYLANKLEATDSGTGVSGLRRQYERPLWLLMGITGLVLLIACANLANLLLARASVREREFALRLALGASRWRLVRQLLVESMLLALAAAIVGAAVAQLLSRGLLTFLTTANNQLFVNLSLDWRVLGFTAALALLTCMLFGLMPALRATGDSPASAIRAGGRGMTAGRERNGFRRALVAIQVAFSLVLLVGALLFVRSLRNLLSTGAGFRAEGILTVNVDFGRTQFPDERRLAVFREMQARLANVPGVISAAQVLFTPVSGSGWNNDIGPDGATAAASGKQAFFNRVSPGYFAAMGTALIAGREFNDRDTLSSPKVAIVNEAFARKFLGGGNAVGHTFRREAPAGKPEEVYQIAGMVNNTKYRELREEFLPIAFLPIAQGDGFGTAATYVLRVQGQPASIVNSVKAKVAEVSPLISIEFRSFSRQLEESILRDRLMAALSSGFGVLAGLLVTLGLYGVIAYMVERRRGEIGVRMALGAGRGRVVRLVLREALLLLAAGIAAGVCLSLWAGQAAAALLYDLKPYDPVSLITSAALLSAIALAAAYGPARRAAALDPMAALRDE
ncbi:MAG: ABC transporter permease [Bryobacterales bacterium]|nr:ABC transporter permease [Bryobacterales bacterium]